MEEGREGRREEGREEGRKGGGREGRMNALLTKRRWLGGASGSQREFPKRILVFLLHSFSAILYLVFLICTAVYTDLFLPQWLWSHYRTKLQFWLQISTNHSLAVPAI